MLNQEESELLQAYVQDSQPGMAYRRRVQIILLADSGSTPELIAAELNIPVSRVRQFIRVFNRERLNLFPPAMFAPSQPFSPDDPIAEAGRRVMATLIEKIQSHESDLLQETDIFSVHETRKSCRRLRTAFRILKTYRKQFRKYMRCLARSRDNAVFLMKFESYRDDILNLGDLSDLEQQSMVEFESFWRKSQDKADERARDLIVNERHQKTIQDFDEFAHSTGTSVLTRIEPDLPDKTRYIAPILLYQKAAAVRAYDGYTQDASMKMLHALRIQCKELRYTIEFFIPVLGPRSAEILSVLKSLLTHLGDLNDARIALEMMEKVEDPALMPFTELYRREKTFELETLISDFSGHWSLLSQPAWRRALAEAVAVL